MRTSLSRTIRFILITACATAAAGSSARAADPQADAREIIQAMADTVIATLAESKDKTAREALFGGLYRKNFDHAGIGAWAAGRAYAAATPAQQQAYLAALETYIVKAYAYQLSRYKGERLRVHKTEADTNNSRRDVIVISHLVHPDPTESREIEMRWRLHKVGDKLLVSDVVIDKISMALTERRAFTDWLKERGGTLEGLTAKLREKVAEFDK